MNDTIRKAVKLADGFSISTSGTYQTPRGNSIEYQVLEDALAAQLVRQVDAALKDWRCLELFEGHTAVRKFEVLSKKSKDIAACYGKGRTMNTIKAIVDSKVLEDG